MTDTVRDWTAILKAAGVPPHCVSLRPFVCRGFPSSCDVVIIGENSATELKTDWWNFWSDEDGFVYSRFEEVRAEKCNNEGKGTRARLDRMMERPDIKCVITNFFSNEKPDGAGRKSERVCNGEVLRALLENMPLLRAVIVHGLEAQRKWENEGWNDVGFVRGDIADKGILRIPKGMKNMADLDGKFAGQGIFFTPHFRETSGDIIKWICGKISAQKGEQR